MVLGPMCHCDTKCHHGYCCSTLLQVKRCRPIASPNSAFICNLLEWHKFRVDKVGIQISAFVWAIHYPKIYVLITITLSLQDVSQGGIVFRMAYHSHYDRETLVPKLCRTSTIDRTLVPATLSSLDSRGTFVIQPPLSGDGKQRPVYIWRGRQATDESLVVAEMFAKHFSRVEGFQGDVVFFKEGEGNPLPLQPGDGAASEGSAMYYEDLVAPNQAGNDRCVQPVPQQQPTEAAAITSCNTVSSAASAGAADENGDTTQDAGPVKLFRLLLSTTAITPHDATKVEWEDMGVYDPDDLEPHHAYLLLNPAEDEQSFIWLGDDFRLPSDQGLEESEEALRERVRAWADSDKVRASVKTLSTRGAAEITLSIEIEGEESEGFWTVFESGY